MPKKIFDIVPPKKEPIKELPKATLPKAIQPKTIPSKSYYKEILILLAIVFVCGSVFAYFNFSDVEIKVWPKKERLTFEQEFVARVGENAKKVEAQRTKSAQFPASGLVEKQGKAKGVIRVYNNYELPQILVASTRFLSTEDKLFRSQRRVEIPAGKHIDIEVVAANPGAEYNIGPSTFSVPGLAGSPRYTSVYGKSFSDMTGGNVWQVKKVTEQDLASAQEQLEELAKAELKSTLTLKAGKDYVLLDRAINYQVLQSSSLAQPATEIDEFEYELTMKAEGLSFSKQAAKEFASNYLSSKSEDNKKILEESLSLKYDVRSIDIEQGKLGLSLQFSGLLYNELNLASVKNAISGRPLNEVRLFFDQNPQIEKTEIRFWPFWKSKIPSALEKIKIDLKL